MDEDELKLGYDSNEYTPTDEADNSALPKSAAGTVRKPAGYDSAQNRQLANNIGGSVAGGAAFYGANAAIHDQVVHQYDHPQISPSLQTDAYGRPIWGSNQGQLAYDASHNYTHSHAQDRAQLWGYVANSAGSGAKDGSSYGPWGAGIEGFVHGVVGGWSMGNAQRQARDRASKQQMIAKMNLSAAQKNYGNLATQYNNKQLAQDNYNQLSNNQVRLQNLWDIQSGNQYV